MPNALDSIGPTPRNALMGTLADYLSRANAYAQRGDRSMPMGKSNPVLSLLANGIGLGDVAATADRASYGLPLTQGQGQAMQMLPETRNALMTVGPMAAKYPMAAGKAAMALGTGGADAIAAQRAAIVWHGSPHKFDAFDASKIGTGEGAQAYGNGLYLAESKKVADGYAGKLSKPTIQFATGIEATGDLSALSPAAREVAQRMQKTAEVTAYGSKADMAGRHLWDAPESVQRELMGSAEPWKAFKVLDSGSLYKVDIPDAHIARMLDWDKPLSQQAPGVQNAFPITIDGAREMGRQAREIRKQVDLLYETDPVAALALHNKATSLDARRGAIGQGDAPGSDLYRTLMNKSPKDAADMLRQLGIPGIRYLDGGSRGAGTGSSNFVVFPGEETALQILERNGQRLR